MDAVVAVEEDCPLPEAAGKFRIRNDDLAGRNRAFNVEALLGVSPDAVVAKRDLAAALEPLHVRLVWSPAPPVIDAVPDYVMSLARLVGKEDAGRAACATFAADMARVRSRCEGL
jgi:ABC-type hemin transport system substrate-binding protein